MILPAWLFHWSPSMVPTWWFVLESFLLAMALLGWGATIALSMRRCMKMFEAGRIMGDDQGWKRAHDQVVKAVAKRKRRTR